MHRGPCSLGNRFRCVSRAAVSSSLATALPRKSRALSCCSPIFRLHHRSSKQSTSTIVAKKDTETPSQSRPSLYETPSALTRVIELTRDARKLSRQRTSLASVAPEQALPYEGSVTSETRRALKVQAGRRWKGVEEAADLLREAGVKLVSQHRLGLTSVTDNRKLAKAYAGLMAEVLSTRISASTRSGVPRRAGHSEEFLQSPFRPVERAMRVWQLARELEQWNLPQATLRIEHFTALVESLTFLPRYPVKERSGVTAQLILSASEAMPSIVEKMASLQVCADDSLAKNLLDKIHDAALDRDKRPPPYYEPWNLIARRALASFLRTYEQEKVRRNSSDSEVGAALESGSANYGTLFSPWEYIISTGRIPASFVQPTQFATFPFPRALRSYLALELDVLSQMNVSAAKRDRTGAAEVVQDKACGLNDKQLALQEESRNHAVRIVKLLIAHEHANNLDSAGVSTGKNPPSSSCEESHLSKTDPASLPNSWQRASPIDLRLCIATKQWSRAVFLLQARLDRSTSTCTTIDPFEAYNLRASIVRLVISALQQLQLDVAIQVLETVGSRHSLQSGLWDATRIPVGHIDDRVDPAPRQRPPIATFVQLWRKTIGVATSYRPIKRPVFSRIPKRRAQPWLPVRRSLLGLQAARETAIALEERVDPFATLVAQQRIAGSETSHRAQSIAKRFGRIWDSGLVAGVMRSASQVECETILRQEEVDDDASPLREALALLCAQQPDKRARIWAKRSVLRHFHVTANGYTDLNNDPGDEGYDGRRSNGQAMEAGAGDKREGRAVSAEKIRAQGLAWAKRIEDDWQHLADK